MLFMVEFRYSPDHRDEALRFFWEHGLTGYEENASVKGIWVATQDHIAYALVDAAEVAIVERSCQPLKQMGDVTCRHVTTGSQL